MAAPLFEDAAVHPVNDIVELLDAAAAAARRRGRDDLVMRLEHERARILSPVYHVLVVGEFNKGKSSLVNALLNARVCPADADRATAVPTVLRYGAEPSATATQGEQQDGAHVGLDQIESLATGTGSAHQRVGSLEVALPRELLRSGLVLVDTPGVGGGLTAAHAAVTLRALTAADIVVFVSDAGQEYGGPELDFLRQAADLCPIVICALTKIDFYPEWRRILELDEGHLRRAGLDCPTVPLSAPLRHHGIRTNDRSLIARSGYPQLSALLRRAAAQSAGTSLAGAIAAAQSALAQLVQHASTERTALRDPAGQVGRRAQWKQANRQTEQLQEVGSRWQQVLSDRIGDLASNVDHDMGVRLRTVRNEANDRIAADDPSRIWGELEPWLYRRANEALLDHLRMTRQEADAVTDEVARQFGAAARGLGVTVDVEGPHGANKDAKLSAVVTDRSTRLQLALVAARGASAGAVVTHTLGLILSLAVPITLPATALVAAVLARKTWRGAQQSHLRALRSEAERAVAVYLEEVERDARKESRDTVRQIHRQLRDVFTQRATELHASTAQTVDMLRRAMHDDEQTRRARLADATAEVEQLSALHDQAAALLDRLLPNMRLP